MKFSVLLFFFLCGFGVLSAGEVRVVSLSPALTELICALGQESVLVGRSEVCDYPLSVGKLPSAGKFGIPNVEKIVCLHPDLLLTNTLVNPLVRAPLEKAGIRMEVLTCNTVDDYFACAAKTGKLLHAEKQADQLIRHGKEQLRQIGRKKLNLKVLWVVWDTPLLAAGTGSLPDELLVLAGADNLCSNSSQPYFRVSADWILSHQPDVIVWTGRDRDLGSDRFWSKLHAVKAGYVIRDLDQDILQRPGPRIFEGIRQLRHRLESLP